MFTLLVWTKSTSNKTQIVLFSFPQPWGIWNQNNLPKWWPAKIYEWLFSAQPAVEVDPTKLSIQLWKGNIPFCMFSFIDPLIHQLKSSYLSAEHVLSVEVLMNVADHEINQHIPTLKLISCFIPAWSTPVRSLQYCRSIITMNQRLFFFHCPASGNVYVFLYFLS